jgi:hypothetical protein
MVMSEPSVRKPTKKAFHFPKNTNGHAKADEKPGDEKSVAATAAPQAPPAPTKAHKQKPVEAAQVSAEAEVKAKRAKKEKVVRDSFTMPKSDYEKIAALKQSVSTQASR